MLSLRYWVSCFLLKLEISLSFTVTSPEVGESIPPRMLSTVDLPAPLAPKMMVYFPSGMEKLTSSTARMVVLPMTYSRTTCSKRTPDTSSTPSSGCIFS